MNPSMSPGMRNAVNPGQSGPRTILSVFPIEMRLELRHEGFRTYIMPASLKGFYQTLVVQDTYAWNRNYAVEEFALYQAPISAVVVAENLVNRWSQGLVGTKDGLGPGIMICEGSHPTVEEIQTVTDRQEAYFRALVYEADERFTKEGPVNITDLHRAAAEWMGTNDRPWIKPIEQVSLIFCPACAEKIKAEALICRHCHTDIEEFHAKRAAKQQSSGKAAGLTQKPPAKSLIEPLKINFVPDEK